MSTQSRDQNRTTKAAAVRAAQARRERNRRLAAVGAVVAVLVVVLTAALWATRGGSDVTAAPKGLALTAQGNTLVMGPDDAKVKVTVYEDFQCPYCRQFESASRDFLRTDAADGKVQVTYRPFNLLTGDDYSARALSAWTTVLGKGTPRQALALHDLLFDQQPYENASSKPSTADLRATAGKAGVKDKAVLDAIGPVDSSVVTATNAAAQQAGVTGTPTVLVDGKPLAGASIDDVVSNLEKKIAAS